MTEAGEKMILPWYKQFWPWYLMFLPASAVVAGIATVIIAVNNRDHLVVDNYYKEGLAVNRVIIRQQQALRLNLQARASYISTTGKLRIVLDPDVTSNLNSLVFSLVHPTREDWDKKIILQKVLF